MRDLVADVLAACDRDPEGVAVRVDGARPALTFGELSSRVRGTAAALRSAGLGPGDRVLFSALPRPEGLVLALGIVAAGGSVVLVDPGSTAELFAARLGRAGPTWAATESVLYALSRGPLSGIARRRGLLLPHYAGLPVRHIHVGRRLPGVPHGAVRAARLAAAAPDPSIIARPRPDDEALVVFTSGTTADPRAVVHTRGSLGEGAALLRQACPLAPGDVSYTDQLMVGLPALTAGATWVLPRRSPAQDPARFARGWAGAASTFLVPADLSAVLDAVESGRRRRPGPRTLLAGAAPVSVPLLERARRLLPGTRLVGVYGMTEVLPALVVDAEEKIAAGDASGDLIGRPLPGVEARIEPPGEGPEIGVGETGVGELVLRGPSLMRGYLGHDGAGHAHRTGDLARWDAEGRIVLVGRSRDMLIRGRTNIYPGLYEPAIARVPGVAEALLVGVPRPQDDDEVVVLVVVPARGSSAAPAPGGGLLRRPEPALGRRLAAELPRVVDHDALPDHVLAAEAVPLSGRSRKPDRRALRDAAADWLRREGLLEVGSTRLDGAETW